MRYLLLSLIVLAGNYECEAVERVLDFHSDIRIAADGTLTVTEVIVVQVEGREIRRGILRDFPTDYRDQRGARVTVPFEVLRVTRNDEPERYKLERVSNGVRVRIGNPDAPLRYGRHSYEIRYRTARQVGYFDGHDELYWNVNGNGWTFAFDSITAEVKLPSAVPAAQLRAEAYTGPVGARGRSYQAFTQDGAAAFRSTRPFQPHEGMTIVLAFPKGVVARPSAMQRARWFFAANRGIAAGLGGACLLLLFLYWRWSLVGRDPRAGPRFPRYDAPPGMGPAAVRFLHKMGCDNRCFAAGLLGLGQRGYARVRQAGAQYTVEATGGKAELLPGDKALRAMLPAPGSQLVIGREHDPAIQAGLRTFAAELEARFGGGLFARNRGSLAAGAAIALAAVGAMLLLDAPSVFVFAIGGAMALLLLFFARILPAYSAVGRKIEDHIEGLKLYLSVAEADELRRMKAPPQTAEEFARLLPYAVALEVEKTWADRFTRLLGLSALAAAAASYYSSDRDFSSLGSGGLAGSLSGLGETISAASTPPGSSSGGSDSGGGGSSGGGGGGGGGSGW
jgi:uncharacterized membrane protein YgcG